jgi:hypothetical protein
MFNGRRYPLLCLIGAFLVLMSMTMQMGIAVFPQEQASIACMATMPDDQELPDGPEKDGDDQSDVFMTAIQHAEFVTAETQMPQHQYPFDTTLPEDPLSLPFQPPV